MGHLLPLRALSLGLLMAGLSNVATAAPFLLVSGRWDNTILVIDLAKAMEPANDGTANAIINRLRVTPDIDAKGSGAKDTPASGQPVNVVLSPDKRHAYVVNHSGLSTPQASDHFQHGHPGTVTVVNVAKAMDAANNMTLTKNTCSATYTGTYPAQVANQDLPIPTAAGVLTQTSTLVVSPVSPLNNTMPSGWTSYTYYAYVDAQNRAFLHVCNPTQFNAATSGSITFNVRAIN